MTSAQVSRLEQAVQELVDRRLKEAQKPFRLRVAGSVQDAEWLYIIVEPDRAGVHSEGYIDVARWVEGELAKGNPDDNVLLVPARPQD